MAKADKKEKPKKTDFRQDRFPYEYFIDFNGKQAAIRCGYSPKTAEAQASHLLRNYKVAAKIKELQEAAKKKSLLTADELDLRLAAMNRVTAKDFFHADGKRKAIHELTYAQAVCVKEVHADGTIKLVDFHQTLRTGMQRLGMLKDGSDKLADTFEKWLDSVHGEHAKT